MIQRIAISIALLGAAPLARAEPYESPGTVRAADYLPAELMKGDSWTVAAEASNDGLENTYSVESRFGAWEARGEEHVESRVAEIEALVRLEEISKTKVFLDAVEASVTYPIRLIKDVSEKPKETLEGLPRGIHRWFKRTSFKVRETYHDVSEEVAEEREKRRERKEEEAQEFAESVKDGSATVDDSDEADSAEVTETEGGDATEEPSRRDELEEKAKDEAKDEALDYLKISSAERRWYRRLRVDPSTDNELVRDGVKSVARVEGLTNFGMKFVPIPGVPFGSYMRRSMDLVWDTHPGDLQVKNRKRLLDAGLSKETAREFEDSKLSLTQQTIFLDSLEDLDGVADRAQLLALAIELENKQEARSLTTTVLLLARMHQSEAPMAKILTDSELPVAETKDGGLLVISPAGALHWTEPVADGIGSFASIYAERSAPWRRFYTTGIASDRFKEGARGLGWEVVDRWRPEVEAE